MSSVPPSSQPDAYRFETWEVRPIERVLLVRGSPVKVGSRAFGLLLALVERQGKVASKSELMDVVWPGLVVEENNLSVQVSVLRKLLGADAIANVSGHGYQLTAVPADARSASAPLPDSPVHATSFRLIGRDADLAALQSQVGSVPLVSIVGMGGVGKTSLAHAVVALSVGPWREGVHWIDLAPLRSGVRLIALVAKSLGVLADDSAQDTEDLIRSLSQMHALIALDNCEHLLDDVVTMLGPLLRHAPHLRWLATSQEPLHLDQEVVYRLGPLDVPLPGAPLQEAVRYGALKLFCERVKMADRHFELTPDRVDLVTELCRRLDGLPLALEMAAARVATLGLRDVHDQIDQRLKLRAHARDAPSRQHTLLRVYEWSCGLLSRWELCVFRRLEPFVGGFSAQLAQRVCCDIEGDLERPDAWQMLDALSALVDKSLVQLGTAASQGGQDRFYLLESARDYAGIQLDFAGETAAVRRSHARAITEWFGAAQFELERWRDNEWADKYLPERGNVSAALSWACTVDEPELLARLVSALAQLDALIHTQAEVASIPVPMDVLERAPLSWRARAHLELGWAHFLDGSRALGAELCLRALADFESLRDVVGAYAARVNLIRLYEGQPDRDDELQEIWGCLKQTDESQIPLRLRMSCRASVALLFDASRKVERLEDLHRISQHAGFEAQAAICRLNISDALLLQHRFDEAVTTIDDMLAAGEPLLRVRAVMQYNRAHALVRLGRIEEAVVSARAMLRALPSYSHLVMDLFSWVAVRSGRARDAALIVGRCTRTKRDRGLHQEESEAGLIQETLDLLEQTLGHESAAALMAQGSDMSTADVLSLALDMQRAPPRARG